MSEAGRTSPMKVMHSPVTCHDASARDSASPAASLEETRQMPQNVSLCQCRVWHCWQLPLCPLSVTCMDYICLPAGNAPRAAAK